MKVIEWFEFLESGLSFGEKLSSMTVGVFDGVHRGHQYLIERIVSHNADYKPVVVTFRGQGIGVRGQGSGDREQIEIQSFRERLLLFEKLGIQAAVVIDFTEEFKQMPGIEFLKILLKYGNIGFFSVGNNFRCGNQLDTDANAIQNFFASCYIPVEIVPEVMEGSLPVSSSRIRASIAAGDLTLTQVMLGRPFKTVPLL